MSAAPRIDILTFDGCPNAEPARALVARVLEDAGVRADVRESVVESPDEAHRLRFLGSPTIRVNGRDVEPSADRRSDYVLACRLYRTPAGAGGLPDESWLRDALDLTLARDVPRSSCGS